MEKECKSATLPQIFIGKRHQTSIDCHHIERSFTIVLHIKVFCSLLARTDSITIRWIAYHGVKFEIASYTWSKDILAKNIWIGQLKMLEVSENVEFTLCLFCARLCIIYYILIELVIVTHPSN